jgi:hypothetical protein
LEEFQALMTLVSYRRGRDRAVQLGDLMDRGPDPVGCVRFAREQGIEALRGNHEDKHLRWRRHEKTRGAKRNPVQGIYGVRAEQNLALSDDDIQWLNANALMLDLGDNLVAVHAGLEPAFPLAQQSSAVSRVRYVDSGGEMIGFTGGTIEQPAGTVFWSTKWAGPQSVVYGHAIHSLTEPRIDRFDGGACYGLDTGCVYGGSLCAAIFTKGSKEPEFVMVSAKRTYYASDLVFS